MGLSFSRKVALRYLWSKRSEAFITIITVISILGVAIGVMVLNMVMAVMTGFEGELKSKLAGANSHVLVSAFDGLISPWEPVRSVIETVAGVQSASAFTQNQVLLRVRDRSSGVLIKGIEPRSASAQQLAEYLGADDVADFFKPSPLHIDNPDGSHSEALLPGIVVGKQLARSMGLFIGTAVSVFSPQTSSSPFGLVPRFRRFVVTGIYSSGLIEYESGLAYIGLSDAQRFFDLGESVAGFEIRVDDVDSSPVITKRIVEKIVAVNPGLYARDWTELNKPLWDAMRLEKKVYFIVLLLIIVMASFSIITTLIMLVLEKRRDIAILKTIGASTRHIGAIFIIQGSVIGALGTILGLLAGYLGCLALQTYGFPLDERIFQMSTVPVRIDVMNFLLVGVSAFVICCLATIYPARRASRLIPCEVLRYE